MSSVSWPFDSQYGVSYRWSITTDRLSRTVFEILSFKGIGVMGSRTWPFGSRDVVGHVITGFPMCGFLLVVNKNRPCISHGCRDIELQRHLGHDLDLLGSVTSSVTWPLDSQYGFSYRWSIRTDCLSPTVFEMLTFKGINGFDLSALAHVKGQKVDCACPVSRDL